jgi:3-hydroxyisobutyrate dehydrogenase-like beta-hydroxyacid dehydrogenase
MAQVTVGVLHPGEMGASVGAAARRGGAEVVWASEDRSASTKARAAADGLRDVGTLQNLVQASDIILSVCPPGAAADVAHAVASGSFSSIYVDANAVSPETARKVGTIVEQGGATFVDGGIIGPPARAAGSTRLYLSGPAAQQVAAVFQAGPLEGIVLEGGAGAASALKVAFAAYTKGTMALLMTIRAFACAEGVDAALVQEWERSLPALPGQSEGAVRGSTRKAWRFVGEMEEIAAAFKAAGLPDGFHRAAADLYRRLERYKDTDLPPSLEDATAVILQLSAGEKDRRPR